MEENENISDEELLEEYGVRRSGSNAAAVQAIICIIVGVSLLALNSFYPGLTEVFLSRFRQLSEGSAVCPDPVDLLIGLFDRP